MAIKAKHNPFSSSRLERLRYRPTQTTVDEIIAKLSRNSYRGEILGPHGSGKTTLILQISKHLSAKGHEIKHVFINDTNPMSPADRKQLLNDLEPSEIVFLDGADHLSMFAWQKLKRGIFKAKAGLVITTHKRGMLNTIVECSTSPQLLTDITNELIPEQPASIDDLINNIYTSHKGNIRNCLWQMYDIWAENGKLI